MASGSISSRVIGLQQPHGIANNMLYNCRSLMDLTSQHLVQMWKVENFCIASLSSSLHQLKRRERMSKYDAARLFVLLQNLSMK